MISNTQNVVEELKKYPTATVTVTYSEDVESGQIEIAYCSDDNIVQIIGSADDI